MNDLQIRLVQKKMRVVISVRRYKKRKLGIEDNHRVTSEVARWQMIIAFFLCLCTTRGYHPFGFVNHIF